MQYAYKNKELNIKDSNFNKFFNLLKLDIIRIEDPKFHNYGGRVGIIHGKNYSESDDENIHEILGEMVLYISTLPNIEEGSNHG